MQIQITCCLGNTHATPGHKVDRFSLELTAELSSHHRYSPGSRTPYIGVHKSGSGPLEQLGVRTVSIVPDRVAFARKFKEVADLPFTVLTDVDNGYALTLGLVVWVGEEVKTLYGKQGIDLAEYQGNDSWFLPIPATFVIGQDGVIKARFVDPDFRQRIEIDQILAAVRTTVE